VNKEETLKGAGSSKPEKSREVRKPAKFRPEKIAEKASSQKSPIHLQPSTDLITGPPG